MKSDTMTHAAFVSPAPLGLSSSFLPPHPRTPARPRPRPHPTLRQAPRAAAQHPDEPSPSAPPPPRPSPRDLLARAQSALAAGKHAAAAAALAALLLLPQALPADAASGGGRVGGSSFRSPAPRSYSAPSRSYVAPAPSYAPSYGPSFGFGMPLFYNPFIAPVGVGLGGIGSLGTLLLVGAVASFALDLARSRAAAGDGGGAAAELDDPTVAVAVVKVGLLASARRLQVDLDALARSADTASPAGLAFVLGETVTSLLRHPDFWTHAAANVRALPLSKAEGAFQEASLAERLKLDEETLTNAAGRVAEAARAAAAQQDLNKAPGEYIIVSLVVAAAGELVRKLPKNLDDPRDVERALRALATVTESTIQGVEVVWAPQSLRDTVSESEMLADHPELRRL